MSPASDALDACLFVSYRDHRSARTSSKNQTVVRAGGLPSVPDNPGRAELARQEGWTLAELHTEEGRLDEVFRRITLPDTAPESRQ